MISSPYLNGLVPLCLMKSVQHAFVPEAAGHLLAVFDFAKVALAEVVVEGDIKTSEKQQMAVTP